MKHTKRMLGLLLAMLMILTAVLPSFAAGDAFAEEAYTNIVTFSDCQNAGPIAYRNFGQVLKVMHDDGLPEPDALLVGGDYSLILGDHAAAGILQLQQHYLDVYPDGNPDDILTAQGNHDLPIAAFYPTGMYDMGTYCFYLINEDDYQWLQGFRPGGEAKIKKTAANIKSALDAMIEKGDNRPVIFITHVPLHYTSRTLYRDNCYSAHVFNVINEAAKTLDIIFLFAHNHSGEYDDYIGGSVNFMAPGDTVLIPMTDKHGKGCYTEETLNFTYTNCGYIGYSGNTVSETSTNVLSMGAIRFFADRFEIMKYTKDGLLRTDTVERKHTATAEEMQVTPTTDALERKNEKIWHIEQKILQPMLRVFIKIFDTFGLKVFEK